MRASEVFVADGLFLALCCSILKFLQGTSSWWPGFFKKHKDLISDLLSSPQFRPMLHLIWGSCWGKPISIGWTHQSPEKKHFWNTVLDLYSNYKPREIYHIYIIHYMILYKKKLDFLCHSVFAHTISNYYILICSYHIIFEQYFRKNVWWYEIKFLI